MTLVELAIVVAVLALGMGVATAAVDGVLSSYRATGTAQDLYGAIHLTRARARATGVMHALVLDGTGRSYRIVEDPAGVRRTVVGPTPLVDGVVVSGNSTIRFSPKGFAVPFGTITVWADGEYRRLIVNILGRVRMERGSAPQ